MNEFFYLFLFAVFGVAAGLFIFSMVEYFIIKGWL